MKESNTWGKFLPPHAIVMAKKGNRVLESLPEEPVEREAEVPAPAIGLEEIRIAKEFVPSAGLTSLSRAMAASDARPEFRDAPSHSSPQALNPTEPDSLAKIHAELAGCPRCKLCQGRTHVVVGEGNPQASLMFVGEGPGETEDLEGRPFVGKAGQLLDRMIEAIGLKRSDVYIANVVKCRPPGNRNPEPDEIAACSPFLMRQIDLVQPKVIVALGKFAAQTLLATEERITAMRGKFRPYRGIKLMPTWHPAYLLRNPDAKRESWEDLKSVARELGLEIPSPGTRKK